MGVSADDHNHSASILECPFAHFHPLPLPPPPPPPRRAGGRARITPIIAREASERPRCEKINEHEKIEGWSCKIRVRKPALICLIICSDECIWCSPSQEHGHGMLRKQDLSSYVFVPLGPRLRGSVIEARFDIFHMGGTQWRGGSHVRHGRAADNQTLTLLALAAAIFWGSHTRYEHQQLGFRGQDRGRGDVGRGRGAGNGDSRK